jgi:diguanylate cyclase (GGDEF)-like protein
MDLDQFKIVNDTCGHDAGDELLKQITETLDKKLRKSDLLARLGGDEFGVLLENCDASHALVIANNLRQAVESFRFGWQTQSFKIGVSIGVAEISDEQAKASEVLSAADAACYVAKESGRNRVHFHALEGSASSEHQQEMQWVSRLQSALDNDRFVLFLQRIQNAENSAVASEHYEVLLRLVGEKGELIPPGAFFPAAERFNMVGDLDIWDIESVFKKLKQLQDNHKISNQLVLAINLSGASMMNNDLSDKICSLMDKSQYPAENFCFEVTETAAIANLKQATVFLTKLRDKGCKIALDDFGSGLSSFAYLKELPIDYLKIDGYFVKDIAINEIDKAFVESINQIGHVMNLETIAEFVENDDILKILKDIGVDYAQGFGIQKPCPFDEVFQ